MASVLRPNSALRNVHAFSHRASSRPTLYNASAAIASNAQTFQPSNLNWQCNKSRQSLRCFTTCSARQRRSSVFGAAVLSSVASALDSSFQRLDSSPVLLFQLHFQGFQCGTQAGLHCAQGQTCNLRDLPQFKLLCEPQQY